MCSYIRRTRFVGLIIPAALQYFILTLLVMHLTFMEKNAASGFIILHLAILQFQ